MGQRKVRSSGARGRLGHAAPCTGTLRVAEASGGYRCKTHHSGPHSGYAVRNARSSPEQVTFTSTPALPRPEDSSTTHLLESLSSANGKGKVPRALEDLVLQEISDWGF